MALAPSSTFVFDQVQVRTARDDDDRVLFVAKDVCRALSIKNHLQKLKSVDPAYVVQRYCATAGGRQTVNFVNEFGLYALTFASRKSAARRFQKWIYEEVLPNLRTRGSYTIASTEALKDRDTQLLQLACTHFQDDATLMCLANEIVPADPEMPAFGASLDWLRRRLQEWLGCRCKLVVEPVPVPVPPPPPVPAPPP